MANVLNLQQEDPGSEKAVAPTQNRARLLSRQLSRSAKDKENGTIESQANLVRRNRQQGLNRIQTIRSPQSKSREEASTSKERELQLELRSKTGNAISRSGKLIRKTGLGGDFGKKLEEAGDLLSSFKNPLRAAQEKFGTSTMILMISTAIFFDVFIAIIDILDLFSFGLASLLLGSIIDFFALLTFVFWFKLKGGKFGKVRSFSMGIGFIAKFIPVIDLLPDWTLAILLSFLQENISKLTNAIPGGQTLGSKS